MKSGFSFCGVNVETLGLEYAPELEDTYVYKAAKPRIHDEVFDGHNGGYYYGMSREPKEFILRCFFEEKEIDRGIMAKIMDLFREGRKGKLVFTRRPWSYYNAVVTDLDLTGITNYLNGIIKITMKAYYPYSRSDMIVAEYKHPDYNRILENTAFLEKEEMIPPVEFCKDSPITEAITVSSPILLFNPGNEFAPVGIEIAGNVGQGVRITNVDTGQSCKFVAMSEEEFDGVNSFVYLDAINGKCISVKNNVPKVSFLYHDEGFISLAPAFPIIRNVFSITDEGKIKTVNKMFDRNTDGTKENTEKELSGQYIWVEDKWCKIIGVGEEYTGTDRKEKAANAADNEHTLFVEDELEDGISFTTCIAKMNKITVEPVSTMKLTRLKFIYKPTFS